MKAVLLCRVSTKDQEITGYSLDAQEKMLLQFAQAKSYEIVQIFRVAESASKSQVRKIFQEMLAYIEENEIETICCEKTDRLLRNGKDAVRIDDWLAGQETRVVHFVKENFTLTKNTHAHERFIWDVKVAAVSYYTNNLSEEVRKGQKEKLSQGWLPQRPPIGYKTVGEKGHKTQIIDAVKGPLVKNMFELYASGGYSLQTLATKAHESGLRNWNEKRINRCKLHRMLQNPYYYGRIIWHGQEFPGSHEPIISRSLFLAVQERLKRKTKQPRYRRHFPLFKGRIFCESCHGTVTWENQKGHWYGHCNGFKKCEIRKYWRQESIEKLLSPYLDQIAPKSEKILQYIQRAYRMAMEEGKESTDITVRELQNTIEQAEKRLEAIYEDKIDGKISLMFYEKKKKQYEQNIQEAQEQLQRLDQIGPEYYELGYSLQELAYRAKEVFFNEKISIEARRVLIGKIFSNLELNAENITVKYTLPFEFMAHWMPEINRTFEPGNDESLQGENGENSLFCTLMRAFRDKFRTYISTKSAGNPGDELEDTRNLLSIPVVNNSLHK